MSGGEGFHIGLPTRAALDRSTTTRMWLAAEAPEKTRQARMWAYVGDADNPYNVFDFTLSRSRDGPAKFLRDYRQTLLPDAYGGYDGVVVGNEIRRAGCWAHARRKFVDAEKTQPSIAAEAVGWIKRLYAVEERGKVLNDAARLALREQESIPILSSLKDRLFAWRDQLLPKHPMSEVVGYLLNQWKEQEVFTTDEAVPIDNNESEREMKRICLNRNNSLFVGNERGGATAAILSSITSTCRRSTCRSLVISLPCVAGLVPMFAVAQELLESLGAGE